MKRKVIITAIVLSVWAIIIAVFTGCDIRGNRDDWDTVLTFNKANVYLDGEWRTINIKSWRDYQDGDQLQIVDTNGVIYLTHSHNCTLINDLKTGEDK